MDAAQADDDKRLKAAGVGKDNSGCPLGGGRCCNSDSPLPPPSPSKVKLAATGGVVAVKDVEILSEGEE